jgi:hypothetical protein
MIVFCPRNQKFLGVLTVKAEFYIGKMRFIIENSSFQAFRIPKITLK